MLESIVKSRDIQRNIVREHALEQAGFRDYAEKLGAIIVQAKGKNIDIISDKLHENDTNLRQRMQNLD